MKNLILGLLLALSFSLQAENARGIRNNNAGNIRGTHFSFALWPGAVGIDDEEYLKFRRPIDGVRAIVINLRAYRHNYNIFTIYNVINRWTYSEGTNLEKKNYIHVVCQRVGKGPFDRLDFGDPIILERLTRAIIYYENGVDPYHESLYARVFPRLPRRNPASR